MNREALQALLEEGVADGTFPAAQAVVIHRGRKLFSGGAGESTPTTLFDLASLTKVMATTPLFMRLWSQGKLGPDTELRRYFPDSPAASLHLADLLLHRSGLPAFVPFFVDEFRAHPELAREACPPELRARVRQHVIERAARTAPTQPPCTSVVYSDVGFILLGEALSRAAGEGLDDLFERTVATPLELSAHFRRLSRRASHPAGELAPTGKTRPREPAPGQESLWAPLPSAPSRPGEVDDDNAFVLDGVAGHAGLFGTARDVARFGQAILEELEGQSRIAPAALWDRALQGDPKTPHSGRLFGFDTPTRTDAQGRPVVSSAGSLLGNEPPGALGHLGFTGVSLWIDRARGLSIALCTNRTYNGRANLRLSDFRPRFHDAVVSAFDR